MKIQKKHEVVFLLLTKTLNCFFGKTLD